MNHKQPQSQKDTVSRKLSKVWKVTKPDGTELEITNLRRFCIENNIDQGNMVKVSQGILRHNKQWLCSKLT